MAVEDVVRTKMRIRKSDNFPGIPELPFGRNDLCKLFADLGYKNGAEIGVQTGLFSEQICKANPSVHLICVDPWVPYSGGMPTVARCESYLERTKKRLAPYDVEIKRMTSRDAAPTIPNGSLDFVYIDANHSFDNVMQDLIWWVPKVRYEGIIAGHDYVEGYHMQVIQAVNAYIHAHSIAPWYVTSHIATWNRDKRRMDTQSFFWVQRVRYT